jgi:hypothetical protein
LCYRNKIHRHCANAPTTTRTRVYRVKAAAFRYNEAFEVSLQLDLLEPMLPEREVGYKPIHGESQGKMFVVKTLTGDAVRLNNVGV